MSLTPCEYKTGRKLGEGSYSIVLLVFQEWSLISPLFLQSNYSPLITNVKFIHLHRPCKKVREATHTKSGQKYAVKIISKQLMLNKEHMILNEINILKQVSKGHPNILTLYDYFETPNNLYLVMELCQGKKLSLLCLFWLCIYLSLWHSLHNSPFQSITLSITLSLHNSPSQSITLSINQSLILLLYSHLKAESCSTGYMKKDSTLNLMLHTQFILSLMQYLIFTPWISSIETLNQRIWSSKIRVKIRLYWETLASQRY